MNFSVFCSIIACIVVVDIALAFLEQHVHPLVELVWAITQLCVLFTMVAFLVLEPRRQRR